MRYHLTTICSVHAHDLPLYVVVLTGSNIRVPYPYPSSLIRAESVAATSTTWLSSRA